MKICLNNGSEAEITDYSAVNNLFVFTLANETSVLQAAEMFSDTEATKRIEIVVDGTVLYSAEGYTILRGVYTLNLIERLQIMLQKEA